MFKKYIERILQAETYEELIDILYNFENGVDMAYQRDQINAKDHETLFKLADKIIKGVKENA